MCDLPELCWPDQARRNSMQQRRGCKMPLYRQGCSTASSHMKIEENFSPALLPVLAAPSDPIPAGASLPAGACVPQPILLAALAAPVAIVCHDTHLGCCTLLALLLHEAMRPQQTLPKASNDIWDTLQNSRATVPAVSCPSYETGKVMTVWSQGGLRKCVHRKGGTHQVVLVALLAVALLLDVSRSIRLPVRSSCRRGCL